MPRMPAPMPPMAIPNYVNLDDFKVAVKSKGCELFENVSNDTFEFLLRAHNNCGYCLTYKDDNNYSDALRNIMRYEGIEFVAFTTLANTGV